MFAPDRSPRRDHHSPREDGSFASPPPAEEPVVQHNRSEAPCRTRTAAMQVQSPATRRRGGGACGLTSDGTLQPANRTTRAPLCLARRGRSREQTFARFGHWSAAQPEILPFDTAQRRGKDSLRKGRLDVELRNHRLQHTVRGACRAERTRDSSGRLPRLPANQRRIRRSSPRHPVQSPAP